MFFSTVLLSVIIILANRLFYLTPWAYIPYVFDTADAGLVLTWVALLITMFKKRLFVLRNPLSRLIVLFIFLLGIQISLSALNYEQSLLDGLVAARSQFTYVTFFLFLLLLDDVRKIRQLLNFLSFVALIVFFLALANYFGPHIIYNSNAEDLRAGIRRIYIPGFALLTLTCLWQISRWSSKGKAPLAGILSLIFLGAIFFNLRRGTIIGLLLAVVALLLMQRKYNILAAAAVFALMAVGVSGMVMKQNILLHPFTTAAEELESGKAGEGTWSARLDQIAVDFEEFSNHPWVGSGLITVRLSTFHGGANRRMELAALAYASDLGYSHWVKMYGLAGIGWLFAYLYYLWGMARRGLKRQDNQDSAIRQFGFAYVGFVTFSMLTLGHFLDSDRIILVCLVSAILVRLEWDARQTKLKKAMEPVYADISLAGRQPAESL